jgi:transglutaminase-like putative cysteine protease
MCRPKLLLALLLSLFLIMPAAGAKLIDNPESVTYMHARVVKNGSVVIEPQSSLARATSLSIYITIPQDSNRQDSVLQKVEGPDSYEMVKDEWGNDVIKLYWDDPAVGERIGYGAVFDVEVHDSMDPASGRSFPPAETSRASLEMTETAYNLVSNMDEIGKMFRMTEWVHGWVDYDSSYQDLPKEAAWVFENRKGICGAYSNLLISMLRTLGFNAYYVIGYVYTEETPGSYWGPHGWVEVERDGKSISLDPTWLEAPVDSTHIKFANSPDSNYKERAEVLGKDVKLVWTREDPEVELIEKTESPRIDVQTEMIPEEAGSESYALMLTKVSSRLSWECVLGRMEVQSCTMGSGYFLEIQEREQTLRFCGNETLFWLIRTPELRENVAYTCPVYVSGAGALEKPDLKAKAHEDDIMIRMSTPSVVVPNQVFDVETFIENHGPSGRNVRSYLMLGDYVQSKDLELDPGYEARMTWTAKAPSNPGTAKLGFFSSSGDFVEQNLNIISKRHVEIMEVSVPQNLTLGDQLVINVTLLGLEQATGELELRIEEDIQNSEFHISKGGSKTFLFFYTPESGGNKEISIVVFSGGQYEDGMIGNVMVVSESGWFEKILEWLGGIIGWVSSLFGF